MISYLLGAQPTPKEIMTEVKSYVNTGMIVFFSLCGFGVTIFAIYIGYRMAKAEDDHKRREAKSQLIYSIIGLIAIVAVGGLMTMVIPNAITKKVPSVTGLNPKPAVAVTGVITVAIDAVETIGQTVLDIIVMLASVFSIYLGYQLMRAEDEGKRTNAKKQLVWAVFGVIGVVLISIIANSAIDMLDGLTGNLPTWAKPK